MRHRTFLALFVISLFGTTSASAAEKNHNAAVDKALERAKKWPGVIRSNIGVTRLGTKIPCLITKDDLDYSTRKIRVLLIGGLDGSAKSVDSVLAFMDWFYASKAAAEYRKEFAISAIPVGNPDGWATSKGAGNLSGGFPAKDYPPKEPAYNNKKSPEAAYLWRWIGIHAPDQVWNIGPPRESELETALKTGRPALVGKISPDSIHSEPIRNHDQASRSLGFSKLRLALELLGESIRIEELEKKNQKNKKKKEKPGLQLKDVVRSAMHSSLRHELQRRIARPPIKIAKQLSKRYGHQLNRVAYIPSLALIGRLRLGTLTNDPSQRKDVEKIVSPYFTGKIPTYGKRISGSMMPGHLVFGELARTENDPKKRARYIELAKRAADLGFDENGKPKASMPAHSEMSDSVFMGCPILTQVGKLTGDTKYYDMAIRHMRFMLKLNLRKDGLHRHSPLNETAWGRGNGFPALGLALCLSDLPKDHAGRPEMLAAFRAHMAAMAKHQDPTGMWHQVVDRDESYRELTVTCMTTFAMIRGIRNGWLDKKKYTPIVNRAFTALKTRIAPDATLVDVCTGTGKQKSLRAYYDRVAILGFDDRGGAMSLMVTTEMAEWQKERTTKK